MKGMKSMHIYKQLLLVSLLVCSAGFELSALGSREQQEPVVDLSKAPLYVRKDFSENRINEVPEPTDPEWEYFAPSETEGRAVRLPDLQMKDIPKRVFLDPAALKDREFTYLIPFDLHTDIDTIPGLYFSALGDNWAIYLNGTLLRSETHLDKEGQIQEHRNWRDVYFPVDPALLKSGRNILALHIIGDPSLSPTGMYYAGPYKLDYYEKIAHDHSAIIEVSLSAIYIFAGLYYLFIFLMHRRDRYNLFYALFSMTLGLYLFVRTQIIYLFIPDGVLVMRIEFALIFMVIPIVAAFIESLTEDRIRPATYVYGAFCLLLAGLQAVLSPAMGQDLLRVWQLSALPASLYFFFYVVSWKFITLVYKSWKEKKMDNQAVSFFSEIFRCMRDLPIGNIMLGAFILFITAVFDILDAMFLFTDIVASRYGFFIFTMGTALILANRYGYVFNQLSLSNAKLERHIDDLNLAKARIERSEKKYRSLFDGTNDPVAILDERLRFVECNAAALDYFNLNELDLEYTDDKSPTLPQRLYQDTRERISLEERFNRILERLKTKKQAIETRAQLRSPIGEFKSCTLRLEYIRSGNESEIMLRALPDVQDSLSDAYIEGKESYKIENTLTAADEACRQACAHLARYTSQEEANFIMLCLREMVLNGIEHGNLEISFNEKTEAQNKQNYFEFIQERRNKQRYKNRKLSLEYSINEDRARFLISDEGKGFDYRKFLDPNRRDSPSMLEHGRGILMSMAAFDHIQYNKRGNQVLLEKRFTGLSK